MVKIFKYFRAREWLLLLFMAITVVGQVQFTLMLPDYMADIVAAIITPKTAVSEIWQTGGWMLLISFANMVCAIGSNFFSARLAAEFTNRLRQLLFEKIETFSLEEINGFSTASLITRSTNDIQQIAMMFSMGLRFLIMSPVMAVYAIIKILGKSWQLTLATAAGIVVLGIFVLMIFLLVMPKFKSIQGLVDKVNGVMRENLTGLRVVRAYNAEAYQERKFEKVNVDLTRTNLFVNRMTTLMDPVITLVMNGLNLAIMWLGAYLINGNLLSLPVMTSFSMYAMHVVMSFMFITMIFIMLPRAAVSAKRVCQVLETPVLIKDPEFPQKSDVKGEVSFENVAFRFRDAAGDVLSDISFQAHKGETVAFIGGTGSGKSSVINLIPRLYDVTGGSVKVDGVDVRDYDLKELRDKIGYVSQRAVLFSGTIASNIAFGREDLSEEKIKAAAAVAQAEEFIDSKEEKFDAPIAQGGANVSGGQKQRISIARAVAKSPEIYIFDDSFSALDYKTDFKLRSALKAYTGDATCLIVAQRIGTIIGADRIVVLDKGQVVGIGTHSQLLQTCEVYRQIAYSQLSKEELVNA